MILIPSALHSLLTQLTCREGAPHTAILTSSAQSGGSIISSHSVPPSQIIEPFQKPYRAGLDRPDREDHEGEEEEEDGDDEEVRVGMYAALAVGTWNEQRGNTQVSSRSVEPLTLETEVGRISVISIAKGNFLLILAGTEITPWKVLDKKIRAAEEYLREPLSKISA
ncbi:hypothetical protein JCM16303_006601 [Sporobolomyces ruberrimus]